MEAFPLQHKWRPVVLLGGLSLIVGIECVILITLPVVATWKTRLPMDDRSELWPVLAFDAVLLTFLVWGIWHLIALTLTRIDSQGITAPRLFSAPVTILWDDIRNISGGPRSCVVRSASHSIRLSSLHTGGESLGPTLRKLAPPGAFH
jgi:hypothetical protein